MSQVPRPEERMENAIRDLQTAVNELRVRQTSVPIYASDPTDSVVRLWMLNDGRLRGRRADGTVVEYTLTTAGGAASTQPPAASEYTPSTQVYEQDADWSECWKNSGTTVYDYTPNELYYGYWSSTNGEYKSMIHFPSLNTLAPGPVGTRIAEVWLRLSNVHTYSDAGGRLRLGYHGSAGVPATFQEIAEIGSISVGKPSPDRWYQLPNWVGDRAADGTLQGITLNQNNASRSAYGYAAGVGSEKGSRPRFKIVFVK